ncbi:hypothetical protein [Parasedimentitalea huanghaiensis]|uniref:Uncharacterized protein n=1 Tax=Parasedimentitalea huanghaiensis TaxID=2682100 RepID=A0A6L6WAX6_9RHOB|nr:hypothetical protein [Zongyanglinia huanghaiensis]MVO14824.1 hypothetical protein [Zongyanglinia huanghaiensis]
MNSDDQVAGEKQVQEILIEPLEGLGLGRPTTTNKEQFEKMKRTLRQGLASMSAESLTELLEWAMRHAGGPRRDRFPIGKDIMLQARSYQGQSRGSDPSPLFRDIFASPLGQEAISKGWAPELLDWLRDLPMGERKWPGKWTQTQIKDMADGPKRRLEDIEMKLSRNDDVSREDQAFRNKRRAAIQRCQDIAELAQTEGGA